MSPKKFLLYCFTRTNPWFETWRIFVVQSLNCVRLFSTPWTAAFQASLSFTISQSLLKFIPIKLVMPSNNLVLCHPFSCCLQFFAASGYFPASQLFVSGSQPKYWRFSISPSSDYSGLTPFSIDRFDLLEVQGTLKSLLWHHSSKASLLWWSVFFMVQLSHQ